MFVVIAETPSGYSFDNDVKHSSPFANHTVTQTSDMTHPSILVKSEWGMATKNSITQMITGKAGLKMLETRKEKQNFFKRYNNGGIVGLLFNNTHGYRLGRYKHLNGEAPSVAELANLLGSISRSSKDVKVRGSPLEYKRLLDYFQFLLAQKVSGTDSLYLVRPNNANIIANMKDTGGNIKDTYMELFDGDVSNRTMYKKVYFLSSDRPAAIASAIRQVPTIFQESDGKKLHVMPDGNNNSMIRRYLNNELKRIGYTISSSGIVSLGNVKIIDKTEDIKWYLDTGVLFNKTLPNLRHRALLLFYWVFNYPQPSSTNIPVIKAFFSIVDTFHDFKPTKRTNGKGGNNSTAIGSLMGKEKNRQNFRARKANTINLNNVSNTKIAHKTLVRLLGSDIYRKVRSGYSKSLKNIISGVNKRNLSPDEKVGRFLYFVTSMFGSDSGGLIKECEDLSRDILIDISGNKPIYIPVTGNIKKSNRLCDKLESEGACMIIDAMAGKLPDCLKKYSVYHNVGALDRASKRILTWSEVTGSGCPEDQGIVKRKEKKEEKEAKKLLRSQEEKNAAKKRQQKSTATRIRRKQEEQAKARQELLTTQRKKEAATARRGGVTVQTNVKPFIRTNLPSNMKMTIGKVSPKKPTTAKKPPLPPTLKRPRNNNQNTNKPPAKKPPLPPRTVTGLSRGPNNAPATGTRSARTEQARRTAPPAAGTRSATVRRTPRNTRTPGTARRTPGTTRTPGTARPRRTPGTVQV